MKGFLNLKISYQLTYSKDAGCWIYHNKKYLITGYGYTKKEARLMFLECCNQALTIDGMIKKNEAI